MAHSREVIDAADLAVKKVFFLLGVDVEDAESIEDFRQDLRFGRKLRRLSDNGTVGIVGLMVLGVVTAFWHGLVTLLRDTK